MICAETDEAAMAQLEDAKWFFDSWSLPFGQPMARLLVGSPYTITAAMSPTSRASNVDLCLRRSR